MSNFLLMFVILVEFELMFPKSNALVESNITFVSNAEMAYWTKINPMDSGPVASGVCFMYDTGKPILINKKHWDSYDLTQKKVLIFHELTHCLLRYRHSENPKSIMNPRIKGSYDLTWTDLKKLLKKEIDSGLLKRYHK